MNQKRKHMKNIKMIDDVVKILENSGYNEEAINDFIELVKPFYDFYDYMQETHNMDYDMVEKDSGKYSEELFEEYLEKMLASDNPAEYMLEISADIMARYADKYGYKDSEKVKISLRKYTELMFISKMNNDII